MALSSKSWPTDEWMGCSALLPWHSQARAVPWLSGWGVSVTPKALSGESWPTDEWLGCSVLLPWHSQARAVPWLSGWGVQCYPHGTLKRELSHGRVDGVFSVTPMALSSESWPTDEWMGCSVLPPWHSQARAVPRTSGWGVSVTPKALSSESCPTDEWMGCSVLPPWHSQARAGPRTSGWGVQCYPHGTLKRELSHGRVDGVFSVTPMALSSESCPTDEWMGCSVLPPWHSQARAGPRTSGWGVQCYPHGTLKRELAHGRVDGVFSVTPMALSSESWPTDEWMGCSVLPPWHSQARAGPRTSGWGVQCYPHGTLKRELAHGRVDGVFSVTPMALSSETCPMDDQMGCSALLPWHSQVRGDPWMSGWGVSVTPMALSSESWPTYEWMWCSVLPPWHSQARAVPRTCGCGV